MNLARAASDFMFECASERLPLPALERFKSAAILMTFDDCLAEQFISKDDLTGEETKQLQQLHLQSRSERIRVIAESLLGAGTRASIDKLTLLLQVNADPDTAGQIPALLVRLTKDSKKDS